MITITKQNKDLKMHELPLTNKILETAIDFAEKNNAVQIQEINLLIGELSDIEEHWLNHYFKYISKDTIASDANLKITRVNIKWLCLNCFFEFRGDKKSDKPPKCPKCQETKNLELINGREFIIESIGII